MCARAGRPERIPVFLNPRAGGDDRSDAGARIQKLFGDRGLEIDVTRLDAAGDLVSQVRAAARGASLVVAVGGDGTINTVASAIGDSPVRLGVLPLGTLNHFARDVGIPIDLEKAVDIVVSGAVRRVDVGVVNDRLFLNNSSIGIYPGIVQAREALQEAGHRKWTAFAIATARVLRRQHRLSVAMEADGRPSAWRTPFVMVGNNEYDVTGLRIVGRSQLDTGRLFTYVAPLVHVADLPRMVAVEWLGRLLRLHPHAPGQFQMISSRELRIDVAGPRAVQVAIDGEVITSSFPLHYRSRPAALQVLCPAA